MPITIRVRNLRLVGRAAKPIAASAAKPTAKMSHAARRELARSAMRTTGVSSVAVVRIGPRTSNSQRAIVSRRNNAKKSASSWPRTASGRGTICRTARNVARPWADLNPIPMMSPQITLRIAERVRNRDRGEQERRHEVDIRPRFHEGDPRSPPFELPNRMPRPTAAKRQYRGMLSPDRGRRAVLAVPLLTTAMAISKNSRRSAGLSRTPPSPWNNGIRAVSFSLVGPAPRN